MVSKAGEEEPEKKKSAFRRSPLRTLSSKKGRVLSKALVVSFACRVVVCAGSRVRRGGAAAGMLCVTLHCVT